MPSSAHGEEHLKYLLGDSQLENSFTEGGPPGWTEQHALRKAMLH